MFDALKFRDGKLTRNFSWLGSGWGENDSLFLIIHSRYTGGFLVFDASRIQEAVKKSRPWFRSSHPERVATRLLDRVGLWRYLDQDTLRQIATIVVSGKSGEPTETHHVVMVSGPVIPQELPLLEDPQILSQEGVLDRLRLHFPEGIALARGRAAPGGVFSGPECRQYFEQRLTQV